MTRLFASPDGRRDRDPLGSRSSRELAAADFFADSGRGVTRRRMLGEVLVESGVLTSESLGEALAVQSTTRPRRRLGHVIVAMGLASERQIVDGLGASLSLPVVDLSRTTVSPNIARSLPRAVAERHGILVLERNGNALTLVTHDPTDVVAMDDVRLNTRARDLRIVLATETQIREQLARSWSIVEDGDALTTAVESDEPDEPEVVTSVDDAPTVKLVNAVLADAIRSRASDVHIEPQKDALRVRFRVDGVLRDALSVPRSAAPAVASRFKILAGLDIAERRIPQDGRFRLNVDQRDVDVRLSTLPAMHGEKIVARLLARAEDIPELSALGLPAADEEAIRKSLDAPQGLVLITGPTGSGKTSTLYAGLGNVDRVTRNIITLEDPVEIQLPGITQVHVNERTGMTFARGLRAILRQDPDVVLVGEVRDTETADLALKAALTGHLVLTTLHTNSAAGALTRLVDMGVPSFLVASALSCVVAQRLVRRPCPDCSAHYRPSEQVLIALGLTSADVPDIGPRMGTGCGTCGHTGYKGRQAVFEVVPVNAAIRRTLLETPSEAALSAVVAQQGRPGLREAAIDLAGRGISTYEEALRVMPRD